MHPLLVKSKTDSSHQVLLFDVGHGDCLLLMNPDHQGLLVDCGSLKPNLHLEVPIEIETLLSKENNCGFIVSHYHFDHYSLFHWLRKPEHLFSKIYVPCIPSQGPGLEAARALQHYFLAAVLVDYSYYRILPEIIGKAKRPIIPCKKGEFIREANQRLKVLWPDIWSPVLRSDRILRIARNVEYQIRPLLANANFPFEEFQGEDWTLRFFENLRYLSRQELTEERKQQTQRMLSEIEGQFRELANIFSIVAVSYRKRYDRFLFLGDADDEVLDNLLIPGKREYYCINAAHHGTSFGKSMLDLSTEFVLVSRNKKEFSVKNMHDGYLKNIEYRMILSTDFLGHCLLL